ncbi:unnamed protein product [Owenia fusiformis]|uniref:MATH domain-containing protein n=1 Tax=Owenia fusiformis TaxID=6347 RepID=A0A8S4NZJ6_OWEFU|nr:unnamed protein product [Owenia fusiformis]
MDEVDARSPSESEHLESLTVEANQNGTPCDFPGCHQQLNDAEDGIRHKTESSAQHVSLLLHITKDSCKTCTLLNDDKRAELANIENNFLQGLDRIERQIGIANASSDFSESHHKTVAIENSFEITNDKVDMFNSVMQVFQDESKWVKDRLANLESGIQKHFFQVLKNLFVQHQRTDRFIRHQEESIKKLDEEMEDHTLTVHNGVMIFPIDNFQARFEAAKMRNPASVTSPAFYSRRGGYKVKVRVYLNGDGLGLGTHVSIYIMMCKSKFDALLPWPFNQKLTLGIMNQMDPKKDYMDAFRPNKALNTWGKPVAETNTPTGIPKFLGLETVLDPSQGYVVDDVMYVKVVLEQEPKTPLSAFLGYKEIEEQ